MTNPTSVLLWTVAIVLVQAAIGCLLGRALAQAARQLQPSEAEHDRPSSLPAYQQEANKARTGVWR